MTVWPAWANSHNSKKGSRVCWDVSRSGVHACTNTCKMYVTRCVHMVYGESETRCESERICECLLSARCRLSRVSCVCVMCRLLKPFAVRRAVRAERPRTGVAFSDRLLLFRVSFGLAVAAGSHVAGINCELGTGTCGLWIVDADYCVCEVGTSGLPRAVHTRGRAPGGARPGRGAPAAAGDVDTCNKLKMYISYRERESRMNVN